MRRTSGYNAEYAEALHWSEYADSAAWADYGQDVAARHISSLESTEQHMRLQAYTECDAEYAAALNIRSLYAECAAFPDMGRIWLSD